MWSEILTKIAITVAATAVTTGSGIIIGKIVSKMNNSRIVNYTKVLVQAAEQKFPNEGSKMGKQKMEYVMSQLIIKFPKIADNRYLLNLVESIVYQLNEEKRKQDLTEEFKEKYNEEPIKSLKELKKEDKKNKKELKKQTKREMEAQLLEEMLSAAENDEAIVLKNTAEEETLPKEEEPLIVEEADSNTKKESAQKLSSF